MTQRFFVFTTLFFSLILSALPATHSYLSVPDLQELVSDSWQSELKDYKSIIDKALKRESKYYNTHHVFYHAQHCQLRIVEDLLGNLYEFTYPDVHLKNFYFLRAWYDLPQTINANHFIDMHEMGIPRSWSDHDAHLIKHMLSVNFSLFGSTKNYGNFGECSFKYFFKNKSIRPPAVTDLLEEIFDHFGFDKRYIPELVQLQQIVDTSEGLLFQIFVPVNMVDTIAFAAQRKGTPYRNDALMSSLFDCTKQRYLSLTPILDVYCHNPTQFGIELDRLQGRLLFSQDVLLNPLSGVKIFRYSTAHADKIAKYEHKLKKLTRRIFKKKPFKKTETVDKDCKQNFKPAEKLQEKMVQKSLFRQIIDFFI